MLGHGAEVAKYFLGDRVLYDMSEGLQSSTLYPFHRVFSSYCMFALSVYVRASIHVNVTVC